MTETVFSLIKQLDHPDRNVRSRAALNLGALGDSRSLSDLTRTLYTESDLFVREDITWALVRMGDAALPALLDLLRHDNPDARHHAAHTLGKLGDPRAAEMLMAALGDSEAKVVMKAAFALGQLGASEAIPALVALLGHPDSEVQISVHDTLERFGERAVPSLIGGLEDERPQVREGAADMLGQIGDAAALPALINALDNAVWQVRFAVVGALGQYDDDRARAALARMTEDREPKVRELARLLL
jgi:HEAT repeat protein